MRNYSIFAVIAAVAVSLVLFASQADAARPEPEAPAPVTEPFQVILTASVPASDSAVASATSTSFTVPAEMSFKITYVHAVTVRSQEAFKPHNLFLNFGTTSLPFGFFEESGDEDEGEGSTNFLVADTVNLIFGPGVEVNARVNRLVPATDNTQATIVLVGELIPS